MQGDILYSIEWGLILLFLLLALCRWQCPVCTHRLSMLLFSCAWTCPCGLRFRFRTWEICFRTRGVRCHLLKRGWRGIGLASILLGEKSNVRMESKSPSRGANEGTQQHGDKENKTIQLAGSGRLILIQRNLGDKGGAFGRPDRKARRIRRRRGEGCYTRWWRGGQRGKKKATTAKSALSIGSYRYILIDCQSTIYR